MRELPSDLRQLARAQFGLLTVGQLLTAGFRSAYVNRRTSKSMWCRLTPNVVMVSPGPATRVQQIAAAGLHYPRFIVTGRAALELMGVEDRRPGPIDLVGPSIGVEPVSTGWRITRTRQCSPSHEKWDFVAAPAHATLHAVARAASDRQALTILSMVGARQIVSATDLSEVAANQPHSTLGSAARRRIDLLLPGANSIYELDFARELTARGLPLPTRQSRRSDSNGRTIYLDVEFQVAGRRLAVEIDGSQHFTIAHRLADQLRDNALLVQGTPVLRVSNLQLRLDPDAFFQQLSEALWVLRSQAVGV